MYDFDTRADRSDYASSVVSVKWDTAKRYGALAVSTADMDFVMAPEIIAAVQEAAAGIVYGYTIPTDIYYEAVINWMKRRHNFEVKQEWIVTTPGVVAAICYAISAFTQPGDGIIVQMPVYRPFHVCVRNLQRRVCNNALICDGTDYKMNFEDLQQLAQDPQTKMLILCNPHNPVGRVWSYDELEKLADICVRNDILVVSDEIHADIVFPPHKHVSFYSLDEKLSRHAVVCTSPSKSFNTCGLQVSNIFISNKQMRDAFARSEANCGFHTLNCLAPAACIAAYTKGEVWLDEMLAYVHENHELVKELFAETLPSLEVFPLQGTYLQWLNFEHVPRMHSNKTGCSYTDREELLRKNAKVFFESGHIFGDGGKNFERFNLAYPHDFIREVCERVIQLFA